MKNIYNKKEEAIKDLASKTLASEKIDSLYKVGYNIQKVSQNITSIVEHPWYRFYIII